MGDAKGDRRSGSGRCRRVAAHALLGLAGPVFVAGCTNEQVISVEVATVRVSPPTASTIEGEIVQLTATVLDENDVPLEAAAVTWSSRDTSIASVDARGEVRAHGDGVTTVRAAFRDAWGEATIRVLPGPEITLSLDSVPLYGGVAGAPPDPVVVRVTNGGGAALDAVTAGVQHPPGAPEEWLRATLDGTVVPASLTLQATTDGLPAGTYSATVVLSAPGARNSPVSLPVTLSLTGFSVRESGAGTSVNESGTDDTFVVVLDLRPESDVVLTLESDDPGEVDVSPPSLRFEPDEWKTPRTVTVEGVDDDDVDGPRETSVTIAVDDDRSDELYRDLADFAVRVTTVDDDAPGFRVVEDGGGTTVSESGTTDDFTVELTARPSSDVTIDLANGDASEVTVDPARLTFTPAGWDRPQTVTVTGADDSVADGPQSTTVTVSVRAGASDPAYRSVADEAVRVTTTDDDVPGFTVTQSGGTTVGEAGSTDGLMVVLTTQPVSDVVLTTTSGDVSEAVVSPASLTFTPADWSAPKTLTVTGVDDPAVDGDRVTTLRIAVDDAGSDGAFDGVADQTVDVTVTDDDAADFSLSASGGTTVVAEAGGTDDVAVVLLAQPLGNVVLTFAASDPGEATVSPAALTFTPADWNLAQTLTVTGVDDPVTDGSQAVTLTAAVDDAASDDAFDGLPDQPLTVTVGDDEVASFSVTQSDGTTVVTESGSTDDVTLVLLAQPTSNVVLTLAASDPAEATVSPATVTFTPADWSTPQVATVRGVGDLFLDGDQTSTLTIAVDDAASDDAFDPLPDQAVSVTTRDGLILIGAVGAPATQAIPPTAPHRRSTAIASPYE